MEREQELEWKAAQSIAINVDLVSAAKQHLMFLAAVDRNRWLYEGPGLDRAIYRYNVFWLPLLAKHSESQLFEGPLVVPLDCEWIWHCHRLNPVRYKSDCDEFYGRILDNQNVVSSVGETSRRATEDIWKTLYPGEPYDLDLTSALLDNIYGRKVGGEKCTKYDLISAVQRQSPFFYQVSRPHMNDTRYLEGSVARYKGFLHLIKRNKERSIKSFSVPTYDIDLIWHTHQLHSVSYCKDLVEIMGKVLEHDDTDSDRTKGQKLDVGFSGTTQTFEEMYGSRYWRAGAMYLGRAPSPVRTTPYSGNVSKKVPPSYVNQNTKLPQMKVLEVMLEFVGVRNLPEGHKGSLFVSFSKTQPDAVLNAKRSLKIFSESGEKQVASFHCQPTGHLLFELMSCLPSSLPASKSSKTMGITSISLEDFLSPDSSLTVEKWLELVPSSNIIEPKAIGLRVAISVTVPTTAPYVLHMIRSRLFPKSSCLFPLPVRVQFAKSWTHVIDEAGNLVMSLQMRDSKKSKGKIEGMRREVVGTMESGEKCILAEFAESEWSIINSPWSLQLPNTNNDDGHLLELTGPQTVRLFPGGRLDYESKYCEKHKSEHELESHLITAIEFSEEDPYGRAVALLDLKSGTVKVKEEWFLLPGFILTFILGNILRNEGNNSHLMGIKSLKHKGPSNEVDGGPSVGSETNLAPVQKEVEVYVETTKGML
ncbi:hypothetical protein Pfo_019287 [Paulownia fortunei]|nr:hypothetical protein Pfo_019287 [Paulownia fortunei]